MRTSCRVCQRGLTNPKSQELEVGPKCLAKLRKGYRGIQVEPFEDASELYSRLKIKEVVNV